MKRLSLFIVWMAINLSVWSSVSNAIIEHYSAEHGLPNDVVNCTLKDHDGFIWFGTWYGLCRFDGQKFYTYNKRLGVDQELPPRKIQHIVEDRLGNLWVKTIDHKLYVFNKKTERFYAVYDDMKNYSDNIQILKMQTNSNGDILLLTRDRNLLLAESDADGKVDIQVLYDSQNKSNGYSYRLNNNVLRETDEYLCWVGVDDKIAAIRKGEFLSSQKEKVISEKLQLSENVRFTCMIEHNQRVWLGENTGIFSCVDPETGAVDRYVLPELEGKIVNLLVVDDKLIYITLDDQGTFLYDLNTHQIKKIKIPINYGLVSDAFSDKKGMVWFHENKQALVCYDPQTGTTFRHNYRKGTKMIGYATLYVEDTGEHGLFFLTPFGEALCYDRRRRRMENVVKKSEDKSEPQSFLHLYRDSDGILWMSSTDNGVYSLKFPKRQFELKDIPASDCTEKGMVYGVRALCQTKEGDIWVSTRKPELYRYDRNGKLKFIYGNDEEKIGVVYHIMEDNQGNLWLSTKGDGLVKAVPDKSSPKGYRFIHYRNEPDNPHSLSGKNVYYTYQDSRGRIWVGVLDGGLNLLEEKDGKTVFYHRGNSFHHYPSYGQYMEVRNIQEDKNGRIWVGTVDGLMSFEGCFTAPEEIAFETYRKKTLMGLADSDIYMLYKDCEGELWVCVFGGGVHKLVEYNDEEHIPILESYGIPEGLNDDVVFSMVEDNHHNLWMVSENSIASYDKQTGWIRNFDEYDGFSGMVMEEGVILRVETGELWVGCREGILAFEPEKLNPNEVDYNTFIVDCQVNNISLRQLKGHGNSLYSITYSDEIVLEHDQSMFTFEFAGLNYANPKRVSYAYVLEGYEKEWHDNGRNRIASYTNVPPGEYVFKVRTSDETNPSLQSLRELKVKILPPWWATGWAYMVYVILVILLMAVVIRLVMQLIRMKNDVYIGQRLSELKIKFFTNISHELRTPLTLIQGPVQELKENEKLTDKGRQYVDLMEKSITQMLQLVNQILDFRKIQNGRMRLHVSCFNLNEMLQGFADEFRILAEENDVKFTVEEGTDRIKVWADHDKLSIVIRNLLSNAFKFTPSGGNIQLKVTVSPDRTRCYIRIKDSGIGIPKSQFSEIFERFSQAENVKAAAYYQGTGIGLALSKEIMNLHHGEIYAESPEGKGACFVVELLMGKDHYKESEVDFYFGEDEEVEDVPAESMEEEDVVVDSSLPSILIVDDNKDLCNMLRLQLEETYNIYMASDGAEGLKKTTLYHPDVVITDQMMPNMDGLEMLQCIRKDFQISHIPVIILTAKGNDDARTKAITLGANAYITKPFSKEYLVARIEQLLNERKLFREHVWQSEDVADQQDDFSQYLVSKDVQLIEKIHQVIEENLENSEFNIDTIASSIGLSRSAFFKKLKSLTGFAPVDLVKEIRLNKAIELMKDSNMSVTEIAFAVGFRDAGYFGKCFRKKYSQTPREYMAELKKNG
ncbi:MAG: response regulator [Bacteroides sp.]|nr:response regulator [Bacteroides sp.]